MFYCSTGHFVACVPVLSELNTRLRGIQEVYPGLVYAGADIVSSSGTNLGSAQIPQIQSLQVVRCDSIYSPQTNTIFSLTTGRERQFACILHSICKASASHIGGPEQSTVLKSLLAEAGPNPLDARHPEAYLQFVEVRGGRLDTTSR